MSHFTVTICLEDADGRLSRILRVAESGFPLRGLIEAHLEHVMAPFDENREVEPYRDYEEGGPESHWYYKSLRRTATEPPRHETDPAARQALANLTARNPEETREHLAAEQEQRREDAGLFHSLPDPVTWASLAALYNKQFSEDGESPLLIDDAGRAYTMSTRNPDSKWDWYVIGGRWGGRFPYHENCSGQVIPAERQWSSPEVIDPLHCDGGPKRALDLDALRAEKAGKARKTYAEYEAAVAGTPEALPWRVFADNISEGNGYTIDQARTEYRSQPRVEALGSHRDFAFSDNDDFQVPEALYVERARARAVPGYATLTADGRWMAPGTMGWFGMSSDEENDRIGYWEAANAYIGSLPDDAWLISADCHI